MPTPPAPRVARPQFPIRRGAAALAAVMAAGACGAAGAYAAVPAFPDNLVVFPGRDAVAVHGFQNRLGETATLRISRGGSVVGSAQAIVAEGAVAFAVNDPGGVCWGAGTDLFVTPDIKPGDVASISFDGDAAGDTTVGDLRVTGVTYERRRTTLTVAGRVGPGVDRAQVEHRIVNPALAGGSASARPGGLVRAAVGGYSSRLELGGGAFTATYVFDDPAVARLAATGSGQRILAWQEEDVDDNRQGLTVAELGETGGPGISGCPAGPPGTGLPVVPAPGASAAGSAG